MKCSKCGKDLHPGAKFCSRCGAEVSDIGKASQAAAAKAAAEETAPAEATAAEAPVAETAAAETPVAEEPAKEQSSALYELINYFLFGKLPPKSIRTHQYRCACLNLTSNKLRYNSV